MSWLGKLMGTDAAMQATIEGVKDGLDVLVYTNEERANDAAKERSEARQMVVEWMTATQGQNLARRLISLSITGVWLLDIIVAQIVGAFAIFAEAPTEGGPSDLHKLSEFMMDSAMQMNNAVMLILAFYFAAPHMGDIAKAVTGNFTKSANKG